MAGHESPMRGGQLADPRDNTPANGDLLKDRLVSEAEFEVFHGFLTNSLPDMVNSSGKMAKLWKIRGNSAREAVNSGKEFVKLHKYLVNLLRGLTNS
jgi:hypothetical protein